jgi:hypothetical protein
MTTPRDASDTIERHPVTALLPCPRPEEVAELEASMQEHGLQVPLVLSEGRLLDGNARLTLCQDLELTPRFEEVGPLTPVEALTLFLDLNAPRLSALTAQQRAVWAARAMPLFSAESKEAQREGGRKGGSNTHRRRHGATEQATAAASAAVSVVATATKTVTERILSQGVAPTARDRASEAFQVSSGYVAIAREIALAEPHLLSTVAEGHLALAEAQKISRSNTQAREDTVAKSRFRDLLDMEANGRTHVEVKLTFATPDAAIAILEGLEASPLLEHLHLGEV